MTKQPKVTLFTYTKDPLHSIRLGIAAWHDPIPDNIGDAHWSEEEMIERFKWCLVQNHTTPLEYFQMTWVIKNCSRAFQTQLVRHRLAGYSIQSLRVTDVGRFADDGNYHIPGRVKNKEKFHRVMKMIQESYRELVDGGEKIEDARGVLPLGILSPITMTINYRALLHLVGQRLCCSAQQSEWLPVMEQMRSELYKVNPCFAEPFDCKCKRFQRGRIVSICKTSGGKVNAQGCIDV